VPSYGASSAKCLLLWHYFLSKIVIIQTTTTTIIYSPLSRTTWVSRYQKKHSPTHHPDHHPVFIRFLHLLRSIASSLFIGAWQSFWTDIFLNQLIQLYANYATNLHHLTSQYTVLPHKIEIVHTTATSVHPMYKTFIIYTSNGKVTSAQQLQRMVDCGAAKTGSKWSNNETKLWNTGWPLGSKTWM